MTDTPTVRPGGLVTVAFLKARIDEGADHLGIFMPLVHDVLNQFSAHSFATSDVQESIAVAHGVVMPKHTVGTLLGRVKRDGYIFRESGRYRLSATRTLPHSNVAGEKQQIENGQRRLAAALKNHAERRGIRVDTVEAAQELLVKFVEDAQIALLLHGPAVPMERAEMQREDVIVAEFLQDVVGNDQAHELVVRRMLEGLVLYHAAFLPDLSVAGRRFGNLRAVFDSGLVRQALGYEGVAPRALMRDTIDLLKSSGVQCLVFDKTVDEIRKILTAYERRLGTSQGLRELRPSPMARYFVTERFSPSDVREMFALVDQEIRAVGFQIAKIPRRDAKNVSAEQALSTRLADRVTGDELEPRVVHDVDCVAGILTLRKGHRSQSIDDARAVFVSDSRLVIRNVRLWWREDEHELSIEPVVHVRALSNVAWLKKPSAGSDLKARELLALCGAALRPAHRTWERFIRHLNTLYTSRNLTSDEVTAIIASSTSDELLRDAELEANDPRDIDAETLDEVVERVKSRYAADVEQSVERVTKHYEERLTEVRAHERDAVASAEAAEQTLAEKLRRRDLFNEGRAQRWAHFVGLGIKVTLCIVLAVGAIALIAQHPLHGSGLIEIGIVGAVGVFIVLEFIGILSHVSHITMPLETRLKRGFRDWLGGA